MTEDTMFDILPKENRQSKIEAMELGETISISRRLSLDMGITQEAVAEHVHQLRGILDQQATRARRRVPKAQYTVENGAFITRSGALVLSAICTRIK